AAPIKKPRSARQNTVFGFRAASQPNAGQARSPQRARSPLQVAAFRTPRLGCAGSRRRCR
ncbi:hypothetical protein C1Y18_31130, partial [Pseudomonas sp. MPR-R5A]